MKKRVVAKLGLRWNLLRIASILGMAAFVGIGCDGGGGSGSNPDATTIQSAEFGTLDLACADHYWSLGYDLETIAEMCGNTIEPPISMCANDMLMVYMIIDDPQLDTVKIHLRATHESGEVLGEDVMIEWVNPQYHNCELLYFTVPGVDLTGWYNVVLQLEDSAGNLGNSMGFRIYLDSCGQGSSAATQAITKQRGRGFKEQYNGYAEGK